MHKNKAIYIDGERYVPDDVFGSVQHLKQRCEDVLRTHSSDPQAALNVLTYLIRLMPEDID